MKRINYFPDKLVSWYTLLIYKFPQLSVLSPLHAAPLAKDVQLPFVTLAAVVVLNELPQKQACPACIAAYLYLLF